MKTISQIEQQLLDKEYRRLAIELNKGVKLINSTLAQLPRSTDKTTREQEQAWLRDNLIVSCAYSGSGYAHTMHNINAKEFPTSMRQRLLKRLVSEFLLEVEKREKEPSHTG